MESSFVCCIKNRGAKITLSDKRIKNWYAFENKKTIIVLCVTAKDPKAKF